MVIKKDPEDLPAEIVDFQEIFSDINSPQIWIAESKDDLIPKLIVLDGHSTILVYSRHSDELKWEAYHELGQYAFTANNIGDGIINFPHSFYFEFQVKLTSKILDLNASFDGTGVRAIVMPMKDVVISEFIKAIKNRISSVFFSVLKPVEEKLEVVEGKKLIFEEDISAKLGLKLALMGINLQKVNVSKFEIRVTDKSEIVEEVFDVAHMKKEAEKVKASKGDRLKKKPSKKKKKAPKSSPKPSPTTAATPSPPGPNLSTPAAPPTSDSAPVHSSSVSSIPKVPPTPSEKRGSGSGTSPVPSSSVSSIPKVPTASPEKTRSESSPPSVPKTPTSPAPPKIPKSESSPPEVKSGTIRSRSKDLRTVSDEIEADEEREPDIFDFDDDIARETIPMEGNLYAKGMETEKTVSLRYTHATYFERMISNRSYPLLIKISSEEMKARSSITRQITGERISESSDQMIVEEDTDLIIKPEFPGCLVVPSEHHVSIDENEVRVKFHVTPLALGLLDSKINFIQNNTTIHSMKLESKVITHRITRWSAVLGAIGGTLPAILAFLFNENPSEFMTSRLQTLQLTALASLGYTLPTIIMFLLFGVAGLTYYIQKPEVKERTVSFPK